MRNTITINGISSATITGLIIQELPPIQKPPMRTDIEEIDGRPGDVVTKLGYSAYDKTFSVGLSRGYDVDEVIAFFAQSGTITFSNEPDKIYLFDQLEQIDFERLVRFRTAEVTVHVQPFKYPVSETPVTGSTAPLIVANVGNAPSAPSYTFRGSGAVAVSLDGYQILQLSLGEDDEITIDVSTMDATGGGILRNRSVVGDYSLMAMNPGVHRVTWTGSVTGVEITNYTRWI